VLLRNARKPLSAPHLETFSSGNKPTNKQTRSRRDRQQQLLQPSSQKSKAPVLSSPSRTSGALRSIQIGFEYECTSGHRFFLSLDGGVQNVSKASLVAIVQAAVSYSFPSSCFKLLFLFICLSLAFIGCFGVFVVRCVSLYFSEGFKRTTACSTSKGLHCHS
jgi:hypothetical protein